jgi:hypothetical protein
VRKRQSSPSSSSSGSKRFAEDSGTPGPVARHAGDSENVYSRWYRELKKFYRRLPTVYSEDASTPNIPFNNLATVNRRRYGAKKGKDIGHFLDATVHGIDGYLEKAEKIDYRDILNCGEEDAPGKRVVISGAPGCGKTTLSRKLSQDLYTQALRNQYNLVLLVELRKLKVLLKDNSGDIDLPFLLKCSSARKLPELCDIIEESDGEGVAIILDGFDEVADHLGGSPFLTQLLSVEEFYLSECDVIVTTRPSRCPDLISLMRQPSRHVEILGFTDEDIDCYITNFFKEACSTEEIEAEKQSKEVIERLNSVSVIRGMCRIPMVLKIVCKVQDHLGNDPLPETVSGIFSLYICYQLVEYLKASELTGTGGDDTPIDNVLKIPKDIFPGFYPLCEIAFKCCSDRNGQRLLLTREDLKEVMGHIDKRGSIYNLLFSERVAGNSQIAGSLFQFNHKTVQETAAAIHIACQKRRVQHKIWSDEFGRPEMGEVWKVYCGLTGLGFVDLTTLSLSNLSLRARESSVWTGNDDKLAITSLFEAGSSSVSGGVLPALIKDSLFVDVKSPYDIHVTQSALHNHPSLEKLTLSGETAHTLAVESLARAVFQHQNLTKLTLQFFHPTDWEMFSTACKTFCKVKTIELVDAPARTVLAVLSSRVENLVVELRREKYSLEEWDEIQTSLDANQNLMSFDIVSDVSDDLCAPPTSFVEYISLNKRLGRINIDLYLSSSQDKYSSIPLDRLKALPGSHDKCEMKIPLSREQWCAVLSGLNGASSLKDLRLDMRLAPSAPSDHGPDHVQYLSMDEVEELVAKLEHLSVVDVSSWNKETSDLMLAIVKGASRNQAVSELRVWYQGESREIQVPVLEALAHSQHIHQLQLYCSGNPLADVAGDNWCDLVIGGPMSIPLCELRMWLRPYQWGVLLGNIRSAQRLEEFKLKMRFSGDGEIEESILGRVEEVWSQISLKRVDVDVTYGSLTSSGYMLLHAVLRGIAANTNSIHFVLKGGNGDLDKDRVVSQMDEEVLKRFEVLERGGTVYCISRPLESNDVPHCDDGSEEEMEDDEGELESGKPSSSERLSSQVNHPSSQAPPGFNSEAFMSKFSKEFLRDVDSSAIVCRLEIERVIPEDLAYTMKNSCTSKGNEVLLLHLQKHADPQSVRQLCAAMIDKDGYGNMQKLGRSMMDELKFTVFAYQTPSLTGLAAVWKVVPKWDLPIHLGVPLSEVDCLRQEGRGGVDALQIWQSGNCEGFPPTWSSLLDAVERVESAQVGKELSAMVSVEKTWTQQ